MSDQAHLSLTPPGSIPVAAYVRMSTEHQQYSTSNQLDRIKEFAAKRGMNIIRVFADEGKSGLNVKGRESLRKMIAEVESGKADFKCIIAYDVSRWGRLPKWSVSGRMMSTDEVQWWKNSDLNAEVHFTLPVVFLYDGLRSLGHCRRLDNDDEIFSVLYDSTAGKGVPTGQGRPGLMR